MYGWMDSHREGESKAWQRVKSGGGSCSEESQSSSRRVSVPELKSFSPGVEEEFQSRS